MPQKRPNGSYASPSQDLCKHAYKCQSWGEWKEKPDPSGWGRDWVGGDGHNHALRHQSSRYNGGQASYLCTHHNETSSRPSTTCENLIRLQMPSQEQKTREDVQLPGRLVFFRGNNASWSLCQPQSVNWVQCVRKHCTNFKAQSVSIIQVVCFVCLRTLVAYITRHYSCSSKETTARYFTVTQDGLHTSRMYTGLRSHIYGVVYIEEPRGMLGTVLAHPI